MDFNPVYLIVIGLLLGWLIEWGIDWNYWREYWRKHWLGDQQTPVMNGSNVKAEKQKLKKMLNEMQPQTELVAWFDDVMDRASGEYKRRAVQWAFVIGTILAFAFNVDSIEIATRMWREPTLRQVIVAQANGSSPNGETQLSSNDFVNQVNQLGIPVGWTTTPATADQHCGWIPGQAVYLGISRDNSCQILNNLPRMDDTWGWIIKISGLLISGLAAAQGAPFWFDILKKLINVRSSGPSTKPALKNG